MKIIHHYDTNHLPISAKILVPYILQLIKVKSVVDVGCGLGQWILTFKENGVENIMGIDGAHVPKDKMYIPEKDFEVYNLENGMNYKPKKKYDLAISLEVAEHLTLDAADGFVKMLTSLSDIIIFSAAIPNQTGENHLNEQYADYWESKFNKKGYVFLDAFRWKYWNNENVNWWYRQNMYLVVKEEKKKLFNFSTNTNPYIHPRLLDLHIKKAVKYEKILNGDIGVKLALSILKKAILRK